MLQHPTLAFKSSGPWHWIIFIISSLNAILKNPVRFQPFRRYRWQRRRAARRRRRTLRRRRRCRRRRTSTTTPSSRWRSRRRTSTFRNATPDRRSRNLSDLKAKVWATSGIRSRDIGPCGPTAWPPRPTPSTKVSRWISKRPWTLGGHPGPLGAPSSVTRCSRARKRWRSRAWGSTSRPTWWSFRRTGRRSRRISFTSSRARGRSAASRTTPTRSTWSKSFPSTAQMTTTPSTSTTTTTMSTITTSCPALQMSPQPL